MQRVWRLYPFGRGGEEEFAVPGTGMTIDRAGCLPDNHGGIPIGGYVDLTGYARTFGTAEACPIFNYNKFISAY